jgi:hypothetical protein
MTLSTTRRGYLEVCGNCLRMVVHARSTRKPFHMHARSKRCREGGDEIRRLEEHARGTLPVKR